MSFQLVDIASHLSLVSHGDAELKFASAIEDAKEFDIAVIHKKSYLKYLTSSKASAVIIKPEWQGECSLPCLLSDNPYYTYAQVCHLLYPDRYTDNASISSKATIDVTANIGEDSSISANVVIGKNVRVGNNSYIAAGVVVQDNVVIGDDVRIHANAVVEHSCQIGNRVIIHPGAVIGSDGFGLALQDKKWLKIPQVGRVVLGDDVEIGANTTIDRGANRDTIIEEGVKLDNLIQVAHNVHIGAHTAIAAKVGIAGSANIGKHCTIGGASVVLGHLSIIDNTHIHAMSLVTNTIDVPGEYASGTPLEPVKQWRKNRARFKQLDALARKIKNIN